MIILWILGTLACIGWIFIIGVVLYVNIVENIPECFHEMDVWDWIKAFLVIIVCIAIIAFLLWVVIVSLSGFKGNATLWFDFTTSDNTIYRVYFSYEVDEVYNLSLKESIALRMKITTSPDYGYHQRIRRFFKNTFNELLPYRPTVEDIERVCNTLDGSLLDLPNATFKLKFKNIKFVEAF